MSVIIDPDLAIYIMNWIVSQIIRTIFCNQNKLAAMCISFNIILNSICTIIWSSSGYTIRRGYRYSQVVKSIGNF